jgi:hypothetical protein
LCGVGFESRYEMGRASLRRNKSDTQLPGDRAGVEITGSGSGGGGGGGGIACSDIGSHLLLSRLPNGGHFFCK